MNHGRTTLGPRRGTVTPGAVALAWICVCGAPAAQAQIAGAAELLSEVRFRGIGTQDKGPGLRASLMADSPWIASEGAYAGVSAIVRGSGPNVSSLYEMLGWSRRFNAWQAFAGADAAWAWDVALMHVQFVVPGPRNDFSQMMLSLHAPGWAARVSYAPHYFFSSAPNYYVALDHSLPLNADWRVVLHAGKSGYGAPRGDQLRPQATVDALAGIVYHRDDWDFQLSYDGLTAGRAPAFVTGDGRRPACEFSARVAF